MVHRCRTLLVLLMMVNPAWSEQLPSAHYVIESTVVGPTGKRLALMMDTYHDYLGKLFATVKDEEKLSLRIFGARQEFDAYGKAHCANFSETWFGFYQYDSKELVVYYDGTYTGIFFHEGFHQFAHRAFGEIHEWPQWFNEGLAAYFETAAFAGNRIIPPKAPRDDYLGVLRADKQGVRRTLAQFMTIELADWNRSRKDYAYGACLAHYFLKQGDAQVQDAFRGFMSALRTTKDYKKAYEQAFGRLDVAALDRAFWATIR